MSYQGEVGILLIGAEHLHVHREGPKDLVVRRRPLRDLFKKKFGRLFVLQFLGFSRSSWRSYWLCLCDCGRVVAVRGQSMERTRYPTTSCGCLASELASRRCWRGAGELSRNYYIHVRNRALRVGLPFGVSIEQMWELFQRQDGRCALSGLKITLARYRPKRRYHGSWPRIGTASLDRIDSSKGYVQGNVQWVHKEINRMKGALSDEVFRDLCAAVASHQRIEAPFPNRAALEPINKEAMT